MRHFRACCAGLLVFLVSGAFAAGSTLTGQLYVADNQNVYRFTIAGGVPQTKPNLTYSSVYAPIGVDTAGDLFASNYVYSEYYGPGGRGYYFAGIVSEYPPNSNISTQSFYVGGPYYGAWVSVLFGLNLDSGGNVYVSASTCEYSGSDYGCSEQPEYVANIYSPTGKFGTQVIVQPNYYYRLTGGVAVDTHGDLLLGNLGSIYSYASPTKAPKLVRTLAGRNVAEPVGLAVDSSDQLYVTNSHGGASYIAVYPATARGMQPPIRLISVAGARSLGTGIAVAGGYLLVTDPVAGQVYEVRAGLGGLQRPIWQLSVPGAVDVKFGPK